MLLPPRLANQTVVRPNVAISMAANTITSTSQITAEFIPVMHFPPFAVIVFIIQYSHTVDNERIYETVCRFPISCSYSWLRLQFFNLFLQSLHFREQFHLIEPQLFHLK